MDIQDTHKYAQWLVETQGNKAEVVAAEEEQKARKSGDDTKADAWGKIRLSVREMRGPHAT